MSTGHAGAGTVGALHRSLAIHAEPFVADARVVVVGTGVEELGAGLHGLGARSVHAYDPAGGDLDVRDGAFDLALVPDVGAVADPATAVRRLRRVVGTRGVIVAMARARTGVESDGGAEVAPGGLAPARLEYAQLYDLFALQFEHVAISGVLPFRGVVFAELGAEEDPTVSVDTRLGEGGAPSVFVVVASQEPRALDPYAIVQLPPGAEQPGRSPRAYDPDAEIVAALAAAQQRGNVLAAQLEEAMGRLEELRVGETRRGHEHLQVIAGERDAMITRAVELEAIVTAQQQALATLERRLVGAEQQLLERDDRSAALQGELDALRREGEELAAPIAPEVLAEVAARAERAEATLALHVADLAHVAEAHATETAALETQLRERARVIAAMEKELARREHLVKELVASLEEAREAGSNGMRFEAPPPLPVVDPEELGRLRRKLDELAMEVARRDGELLARDWRVAELEAALSAEAPTRPRRGDERPGGGAAEPDGVTKRELESARDELDALRQALAQEHAARVAAESGEELVRARAELARQAALLDQMRSAAELNR
jgi:hypothetical protein